jgi:hypothetical protein
VFSNLNLKEENVKTMRYCLATVLFASISCGCGGTTNNGIKLGIVPVQAQTMFSNSSISGGYAFLLSGELNNMPIAVNGMFVANGGTNITSGQASQHTGGTACQFTVTGSVNIFNSQVNNNPSNGTGVLQLSMVPFSPSGLSSGTCSSENFIFNVVIANAGQELLLVQNGSSTPNITISGTATKQ